MWLKRQKDLRGRHALYYNINCILKRLPMHMRNIFTYYIIALHVCISQYRLVVLIIPIVISVGVLLDILVSKKILINDDSIFSLKYLLCYCFDSILEKIDYINYLQ